MGKKWKICLGMLAAAACCLLAFCIVCELTVVPMVARGAGPNGIQVTTPGWLALLITAMGAGGFSLAGLVAAASKSIDQVSPGASQQITRAAIAMFDRGYVGTLESRFNQSTDADEKTLLRQLVQKYNDNLIKQKFPEDKTAKDTHG